MALIEDRPFMDYVVRGLTRFGIDDIIFAVGYKGGMVEEYFGNGGRPGLRHLMHMRKSFWVRQEP